MTTLYANPYDTSYTGFYFDSSEEFDLKLSNAKYEEVEIDYIDGDNPLLFEAAKIHQCDIDTWFSSLDNFSDTDNEAISIGYLMDLYDTDVAIQRYSEIVLFNGDIADYAFELVADVYSLDQLPDLIRNHIDYDSIARDLELNSEVTELSRNVWVVNCLEF